MLTVPADGTIVDGPQDLRDGDVVRLFELNAPRVDGTMLTDVFISPNPITIDTDATETPVVTVTNTYDLAPATFQIHKDVTGDAADLVPDDIEFTVEWEVTDGPNEGKSGELTLLADGTVVDGPELSHGDVVEFTEVDLPTISGVVWGDPVIDPNPLTLDSTVETVDIAVTNTADLAPATFQAHKVVTGEAADLVPGDAVFALDWEVTDGPNVGQTGSLELPADGTVVDGPTLAHGDQVTFTEATPPDVDGVVWGQPTIDPTSILLDADAETVGVTVTNVANPVPTSGFGVMKAVDGSGASLVDPTTEFSVDWEVADGPNAGRSGTLTVLADGALVEGPQDLRDGDVVTFAEPEAPDVAGTSFEGATISPESITIDTSAEQAPVITVTNTYDLLPASFTAHKEVTGDGASRVPDDATFELTWTVTAGPSAGESGTLSLPADGSVVEGPELLHGDELTFTEATPPEIEGVEWGAVSIDPESLTLDATAEPVDVTVTNTAKPHGDLPATGMNSALVWGALGVGILAVLAGLVLVLSRRSGRRKAD